MRMNWPHPDRFPPDPNAPPPRRGRPPRPQLALEAAAPAARDAAPLERELTQPRLIGPAAARPRRLVHGDGDRAAHWPPTTASPREASPGPRRQ
jgi:hypothetical protein